MLKKSALVIVPPIAAYLLATWFVGSRIESIMADNDNKIVSQLPFLKISDRKFERGFFRSSETAKVILNIPGVENIQFTLKSTIKNGPFPNLSGLASAIVDSKLSLNEGYQQDVMNWLSTGELFSSHTIYRLNGLEGESNVTVPGFNSTNLSWDGMILKLNFSNDLSHYSSQADISRLEIRSIGGSSWKISGFHYESDQKQVFGDDPTLYGGARKMSMAQLDFNPSNQVPGVIAPPTISAKEILLADSTTLIGNEFLDYVEKGSAKALEVNKLDYGPAHLDVSINHLHARALSDVLRQSREAANQPPTAALSPQVVAQRRELIKHGMEVKIDRLSFSTKQGQALLSSSFKLNDSTQVDLSDRNALAKNLDLKMEVSFPEELVRSLQKKFAGPNQSDESASAAIQNAIGRGYMVRHGESLDAKIEFKNSQLSFNDIPYVAPQPQITQMSSNGEMPPSAKSLNCLACHGMDRKVIGPSWRDIARRYRGVANFEYYGTNYPLIEGLVMKVSRGGSGHWGQMPMPAIDPLGQRKSEIAQLVLYVLNIENSSPATQPAKIYAPVPPYHLDQTLPQFMAQMGDASTVGAVINPHSRSSDHEQTMITFPGRGVSLFFRNDNHVLETVRFDAPYAGKIRGVGIGSTSSIMLASLGSPVRPPWTFSNSRAYLFKDGNYLTRYDVTDGSVQTIFMLNK